VNWKHGHYSAEAKAERKQAREARRNLHLLTRLARHIAAESAEEKEQPRYKI
jgi:hypothetical protein